MSPTDPPPDSRSDAERVVARHELDGLPLQFRTIWEKPLLPRDSLRATIVDNDDLHARHVARGSAKPISKIVEDR